MGLKILHSADWHLDSPFAGFSEEQRACLKAEQKAIPGKITDLCIRENCDLMLLAGDIFDGEPSRETVELVKEELARSEVPVLISPGNHDFCAIGSPWLEENWSENVFIFTGGLESVTIAGLNCRIYGAAFKSMDCEPLLEDFQAEGQERYRIAVLHGDPTQTGSCYNPITAAQVRNSKLDYIALGHIHKAGGFRVGKTLCAWPGCPMGRGWDETGEKGACIVTIEEAAQVQPVCLDTIRFCQLEADVSDDVEAALEELLPGGGSRNFFRIDLTGYGDVDTALIQKQFANCPNLELRDKTQEPIDLWGDLDEDSLEGIYFQMLHNAMEENPDLEPTVRLAAEISRKLLSGREVVL